MDLAQLICNRKFRIDVLSNGNNLSKLHVVKLYVILTVHSIAIGSYLFIVPTYAQFYNTITSPLYVFRHSE
jgi:hypothetical protein